ncbi:hypothetical protein [Actinoplanes sp. NPDC049265]|uniref:hypothetical protein n=1 Tax=Actinoplanes sp. NPDC049265 TaxID=3363902 RepID=UPI003710993B
MRKVFVIIAVVAVVLCGVGGWFAVRAFQVGNEINKSSITQQEFDAQRIGGEETAVRDALPVPFDDSDSDEGELYGSDPTKQGKPAGSNCIYYAVKPLTKGGDRPLFRFCFAGGKLTEKKQIRVASS